MKILLVSFVVGLFVGGFLWSNSREEPGPADRGPTRSSGHGAPGTVRGLDTNEEGQPDACCFGLSCG
jgi:hypothetical protein